MNTIATIGIIGYGRFGKLVYSILEKNYPQINIKVYSRNLTIDNELFFSFENVSHCDLIIPSVPISEFESTIKKLSSFVKPKAIVVDVCSVKVFPKKAMLTLLPKSVNIICTHPMFGPGDINNQTFKLDKTYNLVIENVRCDTKIYNKIKNEITALGCTVLEMKAEEHDKIAATRQFITLILAFILKGIDFKPSNLDTKTAQNLSRSVDGVTIDFSLLKDMFKYNPYCKSEIKKFSLSYTKVLKKLTQ